MHRDRLTLRFSPTDPVTFAGCHHASHLDRRALDDPVLKSQAAADSEESRLFAARGTAHEAAYKATLEAELGRVVDMTGRPAVTAALLREGHPALFQARLTHGQWSGHADFLIRVPVPSALGDFSYEVVDTKLARRTRASFLIQLGVYSALPAKLQGTRPRQASPEQRNRGRATTLHRPAGADRSVLRGRPYLAAT